MLYTVDDIRQTFDSGTYNRGAEYHRRRKVLHVAIDGDVIKGLVSGSDNGSYRQTIKLSMSGQQKRLKVDCSCPMDYNCKHTVAVLLAALDSMPKPAQPPALPCRLPPLADRAFLCDRHRAPKTSRSPGRRGCQGAVPAYLCADAGLILCVLGMSIAWRWNGISRSRDA
jgi:hypothetical protein